MPSDLVVRARNEVQLPTVDQNQRGRGSLAVSSCAYESRWSGPVRTQPTSHLFKSPRPDDGYIQGLGTVMGGRVIEWRERFQTKVNQPSLIEDTAR